MKTAVIAIALGAAFAAPIVASAETQTVTTAPPASNFLIVDAQSGRTLATLIPVAAGRQTFRLIGSINAPIPRVESAAPIDSWLTPGQFEAAQKADDRNRFYTPPDAG